MTREERERRIAEALAQLNPQTDSEVRYAEQMEKILKRHLPALEDSGSGSRLANLESSVRQHAEARRDVHKGFEAAFSEQIDLLERISKATGEH